LTINPTRDIIKTTKGKEREIKMRMTKELLNYTIDYIYTNVWDKVVRDRHYCNTLEEVENFILKLKENHGDVEIYLTTNEKIVFNPN
jgi:hypothetical protein